MNSPSLSARRALPRPTLVRRLSRVTVTSVITWFAGGCFALLAIAVLGSVAITSFATNWRAGWWPAAFTSRWYGQAWNATGISQSLVVTFEVSVAVVLIALAAGVPAGYVLARKKFPGKSAFMLVMLLPIILPTMTYAVQLAAMMYRFGLGGSLPAVILVNLVPALPLVILITVPFVEQISPEVENAAKVFGASSLRLFTRVLLPLLAPGVVAAGILCLMRVLGQFELTFFVSNASTQTLVVTIFGALSDPGGVAAPLVAAMTMFYMIIALIGLVITFRFSNPADALSRRAR
jgi:putative spermidine/putrescine transport system permease protein